LAGFFSAVSNSGSASRFSIQRKFFGSVPGSSSLITSTLGSIYAPWQIELLEAAGLVIEQRLVPAY
jgi:hypothetical protein